MHPPVIAGAPQPAVVCSAPVLINRVGGDLSGNGTNDHAALFSDGCGPFLRITLSRRAVLIRLPRGPRSSVPFGFWSLVISTVAAATSC
jgi:hypothetical protein